jgi:hypothetical protein
MYVFYNVMTVANQKYPVAFLKYYIFCKYFTM